MTTPEPQDVREAMRSETAFPSSGARQSSKEGQAELMDAEPPTEPQDLPELVRLVSTLHGRVQAIEAALCRTKICNRTLDERLRRI